MWFQLCDSPLNFETWFCFVWINLFLFCCYTNTSMERIIEVCLSRFPCLTFPTSWIREALLAAADICVQLAYWFLLFPLSTACLVVWLPMQRLFICFMPPPSPAARLFGLGGGCAFLLLMNHLAPAVGYAIVKEMRRVLWSLHVAAQGAFTLFIRHVCSSGSRAQTPVAANSANTNSSWKPKWSLYEK